MTSELAQLKKFYRDFDWRRVQAAWGEPWGGTDMQWFGTILPRIHAFLPARSILEIGPGYGRLSSYLRQHCERLVLADMAPNAVDACRSLFAGDPGVSVIQTDGMSVPGLEGEQFDLVFSVFSLVHADASTMQGYVKDLASQLSPHGVAFLHHSNAGTCVSGDPERDAELNDYRSIFTTAETVQEAAAHADLSCCGQEVFGWETGEALTDCFSIIVHRYSKWDHFYRRIRNPHFVREASRWSQLATLYGWTAPSISPRDRRLRAALQEDTDDVSR